jgi:hypothetical protein
MFLSLNPGIFKHPQNCTLDNGTSIYYGVSKIGCDCLASIPADPDFAGPGIIAAFIFIAWLTIAIAAIPTVYAVWQSWLGIDETGWKRFWKWLVINLSFEPVEHKKRDSALIIPIINQPARMQRTNTDSSLEGSMTKTKSRLPSARVPNGMRRGSTEPAYCKWSRRVVLQLCDIQIFTGIAILVSALAQYRTLTFYHAQFATQFWWLTLNSFWISRIDYSRDIPEMATWRAHARRLGVWTSVALSIAAQGIVTYREANQWNIVVSGRCYIGHGVGTGYGQNMFWLIGTAIYFAALTVSLWRPSRGWFDRNVNEKLVPSFRVMWGWVKESQIQTQRYNNEAVQHSAIARFFGLSIRRLRTCCYGLAWLTWVILALFFTVWIAGNSAAAFELGLYSVFAGFLTWWLVFLKVENKPLIKGNEARFTMGQTLPLFLLVLVAIHSLDVWAGVAEEQKRKDIRRSRQMQLPPHDLERLETDEPLDEEVATNAMAGGMAITSPFAPVTPTPDDMRSPSFPFQFPPQELHRDNTNTENNKEFQ